MATAMASTSLRCNLTFRTSDVMNSYRRPLPYAPVIRRLEIPPHLVTAACVWEATAIVTGWIPTFSSITRKHKVSAVLLLIGLAIHLVLTPVVVVVGS